MTITRSRKTANYYGFSDLFCATWISFASQIYLPSITFLLFFCPSVGVFPALIQLPGQQLTSNTSIISHQNASRTVDVEHAWPHPGFRYRVQGDLWLDIRTYGRLITFSLEAELLEALEMIHLDIATEGPPDQRLRTPRCIPGIG